MQYNEYQDSHINFPGGAIIYLEEKKELSSGEQEIHIVMEGENLHDIAQYYGMQMNALAKQNHFKRNVQLEDG